MQNSWGTGVHDNGYVYVSYFDWSFQNAIALDMQPADTYDYNFHYDGNAVPSDASLKVKSDFANVFTVPDDNYRHTVEAVGFTTWNESFTKYNVKVYRNVKSTPTTGKVAANFNVATDNAGNYTFNLSDYGVSPVHLNTGEKFAVVVRATSTGSLDKKRFYIGYETDDNYSWIRFDSTGKTKTSYFKKAGTKKWKNLYSSDRAGSFRIKALTTTESRISLAGAEVSLPKDEYAYTGKAIKPSPVVIVNGNELVKNEDYTLTYSNNKNPGTGTVTIKGIGLYKGEVSEMFMIGSITGFEFTEIGDTYLKMKWNKQAKMTGYKIYLDTEYGRELLKTNSKAKQVTYTAKNLEPDTEYRFVIVAYKKIKKKTYYGPENIAIVYTNPW
ncbi:MAG: lectin like domain-containing protein [Bacillota bacterium]|nr:lectin like domain-containing protein [Bacillota bacterium]